MYARNNATPRPISVGAVVQISDGAVQTSGASVEVSKDGGAFSAGGGTLAVSNGIHSYTPTQGETDCDSLRINVYKTGCIPATAQAVFSASSSFGYAGTDQSKIANPTAIVSLENTSIKSVTDAGTLTAAYDAAKTAASQTSVDGKPTLVQIEGSTILAKEATSSSILTAIQNLNNLSAKINIFGSPLLEIPDSSSNVYAFTVLVKDDEDKLVNLDASPTIAAANAAGTSRSANLSAVSNPSTGRYTFTYTVASTHAAESLRITVSGTVSTEGRYIEWIGAVVDYDTLTTLLQVKAKTDLIPSDIGSVIVSDSSNREVKVTGSKHIACDLHEIQPAVIESTHFAATFVQDMGIALQSTATSILTGVNQLTSRITANLFSGITYLSRWLGAIAGKTADSATRAEINATTAGAAYNETTDSLQAIRDRGDEAWVTGSGGGGGGGASGAGTYPSLQVPPYPLAIYMTSDLFTYADIVQRLRDKRGLAGSTREMHMLKIAVQDALTELAGRSTWRHYNRRASVTTKAVSYHTASYDASTMVMSIATGTWPTDAQYGEVVYDNQRYKVASRLTDTTLLIHSATAPAANFTSKAVTWMQASYALPFMIREIRSVIDEDAYRPLVYMSPSDAVRHRKLARTTGQTLRYTLRSSENYMGLKEIEFSPVPAQATRFEIAMIVRPRPFKTYELTGTDGAYTTSTKTFTSATAAFEANHVGCILRISASATLPRGRTIFDEARVDFAIQTFITEVVSATEVKVSSSFTATASGKGYTVSDPADLDPTTMLAALEALSWEKYCINHEQAVELLPTARALATQEFDRGIAADSADSNQNESAICYDVDTFEDFEPNVDVMGGQ
jgi:hypothetical protein